MSKVEEKIDELRKDFNSFCIDTSVKIAKIETRNSLVSTIFGSVAAVITTLLIKKWG